MKAAHGTGSKLTIDAHKKLEEEQQRHAAKMKELAQLQAEGQTAALLGGLDAEEQALQLRAQLGQVSVEQELDRLKDLEARRYQIQSSALQTKLGGEGDVAKRQEILNQLEALEREHAQKITQINGQASLEMARQADEFLQPAGQAMQENLTNYLSGAQSFSASFHGIVNGMGQALDQGIARMVTSWALGHARMLAVTVMNKAKELMTHRATESAKTAATSQSVLAQVALETWAVMKKVALWIWAGLKDIAIKGYQAAASVYSSVASIPMVGWILAPAMAGVALAAVLAMGSKVMSASGGFDIPAGVNPLVQAHEQEMILPANLSQGFRRIIADQSGGGGSQGSGDVHVHISAVDAKSVERLFMDNQGPLAKALKTMAQNRRV